MAKQSGTLRALADHELEAADRMKWWGVFLIREKRRLQGIAAAVQGEATKISDRRIDPTQVLVDDAYGNGLDSDDRSSDGQSA